MVVGDHAGRLADGESRPLSGLGRRLGPRRAVRRRAFAVSRAPLGATDARRVRRGLGAVRPRSPPVRRRAPATPRRARPPRSVPRRARRRPARRHPRRRRRSRRTRPLFFDRQARRRDRLRAVSSLDASAGARPRSSARTARCLEPGLVALDELDLELDESLDDPARGRRPRPRRGCLDGVSRRARAAACRRSWRTVTTSTSGASPHSSRISERASDGGQSRGGDVRSAGPSSSSRRWSAPPSAVARTDLTVTTTSSPWRSAGAGRRTRPAQARRRPCRCSGPRPGSSGRPIGRSEPGQRRRPLRSGRRRPGRRRGISARSRRARSSSSARIQRRVRRAGRASRRRPAAGAAWCGGRRRRGPRPSAPRTCRRCRRGRSISSVRRQVASGPSCQERRSSASMTSMISASRAARLGVVDRDHGLDPPIEVALHQVRRADVPLGSPPLANPQIRECSRNSPTIERTRMRSDTPWHARQERADAAGDEVDVDAGPATPGRGRRSTASSTIALSLTTMRAVAAGRGVLDLALDELEEPRAEAVRRDEQPAERPLARQAGQDVEQVGDVGADLRTAGQQAEVDVQARGLRVVVARPDVDVATQARALAPDDERRSSSGS